MPNPRLAYCRLSCLLAGIALLTGCQSESRSIASGTLAQIAQTAETLLGKRESEEISDNPEQALPSEEASGLARAEESEKIDAIQQGSELPAVIALGQESRHVRPEDVRLTEPSGVREPWNSPYEVFGDRYEVKQSSRGYVEVGIASWYGPKFQGRKTSNGEVFDMYGLSAAHKGLPIPTIVRVTNLDNGSKIDVRINDRGPFHDDRIIDLSFAAAEALGFSDQGTAPVVVEAVDSKNFPEDTPANAASAPNVYIQAGAFQSVTSARNLKRDIEANLMLQRLKAEVRVLESEFEVDKVLHKVWIGPIKQIKTDEAVTKILIQMGLSKPVKVVAN